MHLLIQHRSPSVAQERIQSPHLVTYQRGLVSQVVLDVAGRADRDPALDLLAEKLQFAVVDRADFAELEVQNLLLRRQVAFSRSCKYTRR